MTTQNWVVMTAAQFATARTLDDDLNYVIGERPVTASSPGTGTNTNPNASGTTITLTGKYVAPQRMVDQVECPVALRDFLSTLPWCMLDSDIIFAPEET